MKMAKYIADAVCELGNYYGYEELVEYAKKYSSYIDKRDFDGLYELVPESSLAALALLCYFELDIKDLYEHFFKYDLLVNTIIAEYEKRSSLYMPKAISRAYFWAQNLEQQYLKSLKVDKLLLDVDSDGGAIDARLNTEKIEIGNLIADVAGIRAGSKVKKIVIHNIMCNGLQVRHATGSNADLVIENFISRYSGEVEINVRNAGSYYLGNVIAPRARVKFVGTCARNTKANVVILDDNTLSGASDKYDIYVDANKVEYEDLFNIRSITLSNNVKYFSAEAGSYASVDNSNIILYVQADRTTPLKSVYPCNLRKKVLTNEKA